MALKCFSNAQILDPEWAQAWLGQALTLQELEQTDSFEVFQHAADLGAGSVVSHKPLCHTLSFFSPFNFFILTEGGEFWVFPTLF